MKLCEGIPSLLSICYTLGRTVWELWIDDAPSDEEEEAAPARFPPLIQRLINECCLHKPFGSVAEVKNAYFDTLREISQIAGS